MRLQRDTIDGVLNEAIWEDLTPEETLRLVRDQCLTGPDTVESVEGKIELSQSVYDYLLAGLNKRSDELELSDQPSDLVDQHFESNPDLREGWVRLTNCTVNRDLDSVDTPGPGRSDEPTASPSP